MNREDYPATPHLIAEVSRLMEVTETDISEVLAEIFFSWEPEDVLALLPERHVQKALHFVQCVDYARTHRTALDDYLARLKM
jgi:hypothetical protein